MKLYVSKTQCIHLGLHAFLAAMTAVYWPKVSIAYLFFLISLLAKMFVPSIRGFSYSVYVRIVGLLLPLTLPLFCGLPHTLPDRAWDWQALVLTLFLVFMLMLLQVKRFATLLDRDVLELFPTLHVYELWYGIFSSYSSAVFQELFFRGYVLAACWSSIGPVSILVSAVWFVSDHVGNRHAAGFTKLDFLNHFVLSLIFGWAFLQTGSWWIGAIGHALFNTPNAIHKWMLYTRKEPQADVGV